MEGVTFNVVLNCTSQLAAFPSVFNKWKLCIFWKPHHLYLWVIPFLSPVSPQSLHLCLICSAIHRKKLPCQLYFIPKCGSLRRGLPVSSDLQGSPWWGWWLLKLSREDSRKECTMKIRVRDGM